MDPRRRALLRACSARPTLRPPWLLAPDTFADQCTRCGACSEACPEQILVRGGGGFPVLDFNRGECTFCRACGEACEVGLFDLTDGTPPWQQVAAVGDNCLARRGVMCRSCEDACEPRAIRFQLAAGRVPPPIIDTRACTGCGACVAPCPEAAIKIAREAP